jgi:hypothetical protein
MSECMREVAFFVPLDHPPPLGRLPFALLIATEQIRPEVPALDSESPLTDAAKIVSGSHKARKRRH